MRQRRALCTPAALRPPRRPRPGRQSSLSLRHFCARNRRGSSAGSPRPRHLRLRRSAPDKRRARRCGYAPGRLLSPSRHGSRRHVGTGSFIPGNLGPAPSCRQFSGNGTRMGLRSGAHGRLSCLWREGEAGSRRLQALPRDPRCGQSRRAWLESLERKREKQRHRDRKLVLWCRSWAPPAIQVMHALRRCSRRSTDIR